MKENARNWWLGKLLIVPVLRIFQAAIFLALLTFCQGDPEDEGRDETGTPESVILEINGAVCPWDRINNNRYFTFDHAVTSIFRISLNGKGITGFMAGNQVYANGAEFNSTRLIALSQTRITAAGKKGTVGVPFYLVLSSLPLVMINHNDSILNEPKVACKVSVIDPSGKTNNGAFWFAPHRAGIEFRGGMSLQFAKKSYSLEFWTATSTEEVSSGTSLLGLRDDGDWILDAMYVDKARMRNRLSTDIWMEMNKVPYCSLEPKAINATRGHFVELFLNNQYRGLYCLTERIDRNQLNLDRNEGLSYKAFQWSLSTEFVNGNAVVNNSSETWNGWELEFLGEQYLKSVPPVRWEPLIDFVRFTCAASDSEFKAKIFSKIDMNNLIDYLLFMNVMGADDNTGKNTFFSVYASTSPQFFISPWDLDATWGRKWDGSKIELAAGDFIGVTGIPGVNSKYCRPNAFFIRLMTLNPSDFRSKLKTRWQALKSGPFLLKSLKERVETYKQLFLTSGAYSRESAKWPGSMYSPDTETQYMLSWIENRIAQVDTWIDGR